MCFLFRTLFVTLLTLLTTLIFYDFQIGGKWHMLFFATVTALFLQLIRLAVGQRLPERQRGIITAGGLFGSVFLANWLFDGVKLGVAGILVLFLGTVLMEISLPGELERFSFKKING